MGVIYPIIFVSAVTAANLLLLWLGPWFSPINGFLLIGLDLSLRDKIHEMWKGSQLWLRMGFLISTGSVVSILFNMDALMIGIASAVAFLLSGLADALVYHRLEKKKFLIKSNASNGVGALVDSIAFPLIAFGFIPGLAAIILLQFAAKVAGGFVWSFILQKLR